jgi:hypothetical protein
MKRLAAILIFLALMALNPCYGAWTYDPGYLTFATASWDSGGIHHFWCINDYGSVAAWADVVDTFSPTSITDTTTKTSSRTCKWTNDCLPADDHSTFTLSCTAHCIADGIKAYADTHHVVGDSAMGYEKMDWSVSGAPFSLANMEYEGKSERKAILLGQAPEGKQESYGNMQITWTDTGLITWVGNLLFNKYNKGHLATATGMEASEDNTVNVTAMYTNGQTPGAKYSNIQATLYGVAHGQSQAAALGGGWAYGQGRANASVDTFTITRTP